MTELNYEQRKALRRLGRVQTISRSMQSDPLIQECYSTDHYVAMKRDMDIVEWCDWEAQAMSINHPRINDYGKKLLKELEDANNH